MRQRSPDDQDSLDLLLDTITNAFGGIVFMTIMLALLIRTRSPAEQSTPTEPIPQTSVTSSFAEYEDLAAKKSELEAALAALADNPLNSSRELQDLVVTSQKLVGRIAEKIKQQEELIEHERKLENRKTQVKSSMEAVQLNFDQLTGEISELERRLGEEKEKRTVTSDLPSEQATSKLEVPYLVHGDRICSIFSSAFQTSISFDLELVNDFSKAKFVAETGAFYRVGNRSGVSLNDADAVEAYLSKRDPANEYIAVAVWSDSYAGFSDIKKTCVKLGLEYRLILCDDNAPISMGSSVSGKVQ